MELGGAGNRHLLIRLKSEERKMDMKIDTKFTVESLAKNYEKGRCPPLWQNEHERGTAFELFEPIL